MKSITIGRTTATNKAEAERLMSRLAEKKHRARNGDVSKFVKIANEIKAVEEFIKSL